MFFDEQIDHTILNSKLEKLEWKFNQAFPTIGFFSTEYEQNFFFDLCKEINEDFKNVRYPTKKERENAWDKFYKIREDGYNRKRNQFEYKSKEHRGELLRRLRSCDYDAVLEMVGTFMMMDSTTKEEMVRKGKELKEAGAYFSQVKQEMTKDDKTEVHAKFIDVRENHDSFWNSWKSYAIERAKVREEKQKAWEEKQRQWEAKKLRGRELKEKIYSNLSKNKEKLEKAKDALERHERKKDELEDKINESHSDNWKSKAEEWLDELKEKIADIENQITRLENWIEEDVEKLRNWKE